MVAQAEFCGSWDDLTWADAAACADTSDLALSAIEQQAFLDWAAEKLWERTGRQFSTCEATLTTAFNRCRRVRCDTDPWCSRDRLWVGWLGPVRAVDTVTLEGDTLDADVDYTVVGSTLISLDGAWPFTGDVEVTFTYGRIPPPSLLRAAGVLAVNEARRCGGLSCEFPERTKRISAEGMSVEVNDPAEWMPKGLTGIGRVDEAILAVWPHGWASNPSGMSDPAAPDPVWDRI